jgi:hypothetical protein
MYRAHALGLDSDVDRGCILEVEAAGMCWFADGTVGVENCVAETWNKSIRSRLGR